MSRRNEEIAQARRQAKENGKRLILMPCSKCGDHFLEQQLTEIPDDNRKRQLRQRYCEDCFVILKAGWARASQGAQTRDRRYRNTYGIGLALYGNLYREQNGQCSICHRSATEELLLVVDHDHQTGKVRGLLCSQCNSGIGFLGEDLATLASAIIYLTTTAESD